MIDVRALQAGVGQFRLADIHLKIDAGDCHVIVGPTGAGKTFLLETIIGIREPGSGTILINGQDVTRLPPNKRHVAYVPQDTCLFPNMTVDQNIRYGLRFGNGSRAADHEFIGHLNDFLHITPLLERYPQHLSGGEKQRVALARALVTKPDLLVLDEPFSAIDHSLREEIRRTLKELLDEFHTTTLIVTHDLDEAFFLGNRLSILIGGRIIQSGDRTEIYYYPKTLAAASFLGIKNLFRGQVVDIRPDEITISSEQLHRTIAVSCKCAHKRFGLRQQIRFGIRSEAVYILRHKANLEARTSVFDSIVKKIYMRGKMHTVIVALDTPEHTLVEIDIHDAAARKIGIAEGGVLKIDLDPTHIFLLPEV
ncbi:MAG TPA: ATP-binding cassette domain-containing protein [Candidatus Ozemobacteraceae bacterium]|nr:ATP-binding cassette domain-containing protein [Candidatus Ozemobacteraceae bacterium]